VSDIAILLAPAVPLILPADNSSNLNYIPRRSWTGGLARLTIHTAGGNLHWYHVSGCAGLLDDGDPATLSAAYTVSPKQEITSP